MPITGKFEADFSSFYDAVAKAEGSLQSFAQTGQTEIPKVGTEFSQVEQSAGSMGTQVDSTMKAIAASLTAANVKAFVVDVKTAATTFINAFAEEEAAVSRLTAALKSTGDASPAVVKAYQDMATQFQATTKYSDDAVIAAQTALTTIGKVGPENMQAALEATTNLASALDIDLATAANTVAKAIGSGGEQLGRMKVLLGDTVTPGMATADMLKAINTQVAGSATAELETYAGKMDNLKNRMGDAEEQVGGFLLNALTPLISGFGELPDSVQTATLGFASLASNLAPVASSVLAMVPGIAALATAYGVTLAGALTAVGALLLPGAAIIAGIAAVYLAFKHWDEIVAIVQKVYNAIKTYLVDYFAGIVASVKSKVDAVTGFFRDMAEKVSLHSYVPDMMDVIASQFSELDRTMVEPTRTATDAVAGQFQNLMGYASDLTAQLAGFGNLGGMVDPYAEHRANRFGTYGSRGGGAWALPSMTAAGGGGAVTTVNTTVNMTGMFSMDDPQTRMVVEQVVNRSVADALKGQRLL